MKYNKKIYINVKVLKIKMKMITTTNNFKLLLTLP